MKNLNIVFDDEDYVALEKAKGEMTWREFFLQLKEKR